jgi:Fic family protein
VVGNVRALERALELAGGPIRPTTLLEIHRRLLDATRDASIAGVFRADQNWVGGRTPVDAEYVPPPPEEVPALMTDLARYVAADEHPALVQAAIAHAQFESIHPFADGNGRTGRALLQLVLRRRGLCTRFVPPISLVLATWSKRYVSALMSTRSEASDGSVWTEWFELLAEATRHACQQAETYERRVEELLERWRSQVRNTVGEPRSDAALWVLVEILPSAPLVTARTARELTGRSERAIDAAIAHLLEAGVLKQVSGRLRHRAYEAQGVFDLVTETERALASPVGDTSIAKPVRVVPARRSRR